MSVFVQFTEHLLADTRCDTFGIVIFGIGIIVVVIVVACID